MGGIAEVNAGCAAPAFCFQGGGRQPFHGGEELLADGGRRQAQFSCPVAVYGELNFRGEGLPALVEVDHPRHLLHPLQDCIGEVVDQVWVGALDLDVDGSPGGGQGSAPHLLDHKGLDSGEGSYFAADRSMIIQISSLLSWRVVRFTVSWAWFIAMAPLSPR